MNEDRVLESEYLDKKLISYAGSDVYPFHMPGHKRQILRDCADDDRLAGNDRNNESVNGDRSGRQDGSRKHMDDVDGGRFGERGMINPYMADITEISGFDNLHHPTGILRDAQIRAAALYGSAQCFYLVNGSTCGLLAAICAAAPRGSRVLMARNSHKAAYHAIEIGGLEADYIYPVITQTGLPGQVAPAQVTEALRLRDDYSAVIITSPTYEGIVSDIAGIAEAAHAHGVPLIVDEAHGAHLGLGAGFPENAVRLGADAVVMSLHKTLPSLTQTALLHLGSVDNGGRIAHYLDIFETSSPSYVLMGGMDACVRLLSERGGELFAAYRGRLDAFYAGVSDLEHLHVLNASDFADGEAYAWDDSKIVIFCEKAGLTGIELHEILRDRYRLEMEMAAADYVLGMTSIMDTDEGFARLSDALHEIDGAGATVATHETDGQAGRESRTDGAADATNEIDWQAECVARMYGAGAVDTAYKICSEEKVSAQADETSVKARFAQLDITELEPQTGRRTDDDAEYFHAMAIYEALSRPSHLVGLDDAIGAVSAEYVIPYPPGIPLIVPGERITEDVVSRIRACKESGITLEGAERLYEGLIRTL